jgi:GNAT superfamily N-acetyltransferase
LAAEPLSIRPVRPADRDRVLEMVADIWEGRDYVPAVFDEWVSDPGGFFQAGEQEGEVVAIQRLNPIAEGIMYYGGLRVASTHRRHGLGRAMLAAAVEESRRLGFREVRLATVAEEARGLFESEGFRLVLESKFWRAQRLEGGDPPSLLQAAQAPAVFDRLKSGGALAAYGGLLPDPDAPLDLDWETFGRLVEEGRVRVGTGGQAVAVAGPFWGSWGVLLAAGEGVALQDLMLAIRFEADAEGTNVRLLTPDPHPAEADLEAAGYDFRQQPSRFYFYSLLLT